MTKFADPTRVVKRTVEILGGVEKTREITDQELGEMNRRWDQDIESIGRILRSHLYVEHYMTEYIEKSNPRLGSVAKARLSFAQKLSLLDPDNPRLQEVKEGIKHLNTIRNRLAHRLSAVVTPEDSTIFLRARYFREIREERAKPGHASDSPLDILEEFAQHASHAFTQKFSLFSQAFAQALEECSE
jgi:DNA-directed RNA polymerase subunit F